MGYLVTSRADVRGDATLGLEMKTTHGGLRLFRLEGETTSMWVDLDALDELADLVEDARGYLADREAFQAGQRERVKALEARRRVAAADRRNLAKHLLAEHDWNVEAVAADAPTTSLHALRERHAAAHDEDRRDRLHAPHARDDLSYRKSRVARKLERRVL